MKSDTQKTISLLADSLTGIRDGAVSIALLETVKINVYGQSMMLKHLGSIQPKGNQLVISLFDPSGLQIVDATLRKSGFNSAIFSKRDVVVTIPQRSGEEVEKTITHLRKLGEEAKVAIRNIRKKHKKQIESLSQNETNRMEKEIQETTDAAIKSIDAMIGDRIDRIRGS